VKTLKSLASILLVAAVSIPALTLAQGRDDHHDDHHDNQRSDHQAAQGHDDHGPARGAGPDHSWHKGDRLPANYRDKRYVVNDWKGHHLKAPPRGYHWVNVNGDYVLAAVATGLIADLLLNQ
jgi:Ni/Co efflux regulator RcnB